MSFLSQKGIVIQHDASWCLLCTDKFQENPWWSTTQLHCTYNLLVMVYSHGCCCDSACVQLMRRKAEVNIVNIGADQVWEKSVTVQQSLDGVCAKSWFAKNFWTECQRMAQGFEHVQKWQFCFLRKGHSNLVAVSTIGSASAQNWVKLSLHSKCCRKCETHPQSWVTSLPKTSL